MSIFVRQFIAAVATMILMAGCSDSKPNLDAKPEGARLTPREVMQIAKDAAERRGLNLSEYKDPEASYQSVRTKTWQVFFDGKTGKPGNHFYIYVEDDTEQSRYIGSE